MQQADSPYAKFFQHKGADLLDLVDQLSEEAFHNLPMGAIFLDSGAKIIRYNHTEGKITGRDHEAVLGKNFFLDLAACGVGPHFHGRFKSGILKSQYDETFPYVFYHEMPETAMLVRMALSKNPKQRGMWIFVRRLMPG
jgi:photoactive yellow protein